MQFSHIYSIVTGPFIIPFSRGMAKVKKIPFKARTGDGQMFSVASAKVKRKRMETERVKTYLAAKKAAAAAAAAAAVGDVGDAVDPPLSKFEMARVALQPGPHSDLVCRETQVEVMSRWLDEHLVHGNPGCLYLSGSPGTGKSVSLNYIISAKVGNHKIIDVNCMEQKRQLFPELGQTSQAQFTLPCRVRGPGSVPLSG